MLIKIWKGTLAVGSSAMEDLEKIPAYQCLLAIKPSFMGSNTQALMYLICTC